MTITTTAMGFSLLSLGLGFCGLRFFHAFQKMAAARHGRRTSILLYLFLFNFALVTGMLGLGSLFFAEKQKIFSAIILTSNFFLTSTAVLGMYLVFYIFLPTVSPWFGTIPAFLSGAILIALSFLSSPQPFVTETRVVDLDLSRGASIALAYTLFFSIGSIFVIFSRLARDAKTFEVRMISWIMAVSAFAGIMNAFIRYLLPERIGTNFLSAGLYDTVHIVSGLIFIVLFTLTSLVLGRIKKA